MTISSHFIDAFKTAMKAAGITPPREIFPYGVGEKRVNRFHVEGDSKGSTNGWYILFADFPPAGAFGCWKRNINHTFSHTIHPEFVADHIKQAERLASITIAISRDKERQAAVDLWESATRATNGCKYLLKKGVKSHGLRYHMGQLLVPVADMAGNIYGAQRIFLDGRKGFLPGTDKRGHFYMIGEPTTTIQIAEGFATAATLHEVTGHATIVAFDAGNLLSVARVLRHHYPAAHIVLCADDDRHKEGNPGLTAATNAASATGALLAVPVFADYSSQPTDFNDLCQLEGAVAVRKCLLVTEATT